MDNEEIVAWRQRTQDAASRARLATDPALKAQWLALAEQYRAHLDDVEGDKAPKPQMPPIAVRPDAEK